MLTVKKMAKQYYDELEAAQALGVSREHLYAILDRHVFNAEHPRPRTLEFTHADLLLLSVWVDPGTANNVVPMPLRD
jgi:hypothetical protein